MSVQAAIRSGRSGSSWSITPEVLLALISLGALAVVWWPLLAVLGSPAPPRFAVLAAHVGGMLAGYGVVVMVLLMSRAPALEQGIGADRLARWHSMGGRVVTALIALHAWGAIAVWAGSRQQSAGTATVQVLRLPWLIATTLGTALIVSVGIVSIRAVRRRLTYERWHALHLLTYVGIALSFVHQLAGPDLVGHRALQIGWALLYTLSFALLVRFRVLSPLQQAGRHRLRVAALIREAPGVVTIEIEGQHLDELAAQSGQFFRWRFLTPDNWLTAHPFSLSAPPTDRRLRLTVKTLGGGSELLQQVAVGTWVIAEGPYGAMTARRRTRRDVLLVAGGVGITPMRALFETLPVAAGQDLLLLYRARSADQVLFRRELDAIAARRGVRVRYLLGDDPDCLSTPALLHGVPGLIHRDVFVCGPPRMADAVRASLRAAGLPPEFLHEERFAF